MPSSQEPSTIADAPQAVLELAEINKGVVINLRADKWPKEMVEECRSDKLWQINVAIYHGLFMSPWLTDFLNRIQPSEDFVACVQDSGGKIFTVVGEIQEIYWLEMNSEGKGHRGINVAVRPLKKNYRYGVAGWQIWGNHVLAIARLRVPAKPTSTPDPDGEKFTNFVKKYGTRK